MKRAVVPVRTYSEMNRRDHYGAVARRKKVQRQSVWVSLRGACGLTPPRLPVRVRLVRLGPSRIRDADNLVAALKFIRDEVAVYLGCDDADPRVQWDYGQEPADGFAVRIEFVEPQQGGHILSVAG